MKWEALKSMAFLISEYLSWCDTADALSVIILM